MVAPMRCVTKRASAFRPRPGSLRHPSTAAITTRNGTTALSAIRHGKQKSITTGPRRILGASHYIMLGKPIQNAFAERARFTRSSVHRVDARAFSILPWGPPGTA